MNEWWKTVATPGWHWVGWAQCVGGGSIIMGAMLGVDVPQSLMAVVLPIFALGLIFVLRERARYRTMAHLGPVQEDAQS
jgi:hypothetical protein